MGKGKWTRWGRGSCEGWSLEIGWGLRGQVARRSDGRWGASLNATELDAWQTREAAQQVVEQRIAHEMRAILEDWATWQAQISAASQPIRK
jgi:cyclopropane fatty-acyl-phospholipid synthase-like methyltransferase